MSQAEKLKQKENICEVGRRLYNRGLIAAMEGNVSIRISENEILATPSGVCKGYLTPDMIVTCDSTASGTSVTKSDYEASYQAHLNAVDRVLRENQMPVLRLYADEPVVPFIRRHMMDLSIVRH